MDSRMVINTTVKKTVENTGAVFEVTEEVNCEAAVLRGRHVARLYWHSVSSNQAYESEQLEENCGHNHCCEQLVFSHRFSPMAKLIAEKNLEGLHCRFEF